MIIKGFEKTSLVDYPGHIAATVFTGGCNMRCPFCHNKELVVGGFTDCIPIKEFFDFIKKRQSILEAVCITGGEPTMQSNLLEFIETIKSYGLKTKLDTNGLNPEMLKTAINHGLLDYIAMDIKNGLPKYSMTTGIHKDQLSLIAQSVALIKDSHIDYEFRTTVVKELHSFEDLENIGQWLNGANAYYLQQYKFSENQLSPTPYNAYSAEEMTTIKDILIPFFKRVELRNI